MIKSLNSSDYSEVTIAAYKVLSNKYGYSARISSFWNLLADTYGISEFEILDLRTTEAIFFESFITDQYIDWINNREVDFSKTEEAMFRAGDFTGTEKILLSTSNLQERIWAIFLCLSDPNLNL